MSCVLLLSVRIIKLKSSSIIDLFSIFTGNGEFGKINGRLDQIQLHLIYYLSQRNVIDTIQVTFRMLTSGLDVPLKARESMAQYNPDTQNITHYEFDFTKDMDFCDLDNDNQYKYKPAEIDLELTAKRILNIKRNTTSSAMTILKSITTTLIFLFYFIFIVTVFADCVIYNL